MTGLKHQPERTCLGCGRKKPQDELLRVFSLRDGLPELDKTGKAGGRGAYLCCDISCLDRAWKRKAVQRALKLSAPPGPELQKAVAKWIQER